MAADRWTWTPAEWERIVKRAREHRLRRETVRSATPGSVLHKAATAVVRGTALELRQWADVAVTTYTTPHLAAQRTCIMASPFMPTRLVDDGPADGW